MSSWDCAWFWAKSQRNHDLSWTFPSGATAHGLGHWEDQYPVYPLWWHHQYLSVRKNKFPWWAGIQWAQWYPWNWSLEFNLLGFGPRDTLICVLVLFVLAKQKRTTVAMLNLSESPMAIMAIMAIISPGSTSSCFWTRPSQSSWTRSALHPALAVLVAVVAVPSTRPWRRWPCVALRCWSVMFVGQSVCWFHRSTIHLLHFPYTIHKPDRYDRYWSCKNECLQTGSSSRYLRYGGFLKQGYPFIAWFSSWIPIFSNLLDD